MRKWIGLVEDLLEKQHHHKKKQHHTTGVHYGYFPHIGRGIYACGFCGAHNHIEDCKSSCPSCNGPTGGAATNSGASSPPAATGGAAAGGGDAGGGAAAGGGGGGGGT